MKKLIFVRHGESTANLDGTYGCQSMVSLTEKGKEQAYKTSEKLLNKNISTIYCSDLKRAIQTAEIINKKLNLNIVLWKNLREKDCGEYTGKKKIKRINTYINKDGESVDDLLNRAKETVNKIKKLKEKGDILFVGHNTFTAFLFYVFNNIKTDPLEYRKQWKFKNGEIKEFIIK